MIDFKNLKWMLCLALLLSIPTLSAPSTPLLKEVVSSETSNPTDIKPSQNTKGDSLPASQEGDSENMPILEDVVPPKNPPASKTPPHLGQIPQNLKTLPLERTPPSLGQISEDLRQTIMEKDPHIPEELPEELKDPPPEKTPPPLGQISEGLRQIIMEKDPHIPEELPEDLTDASTEKPPPTFSRNMNVLDTLMSTERHNPEIQAVTQLLMQAIEKGDSEHYRILIKYILMSYSPIQVLSILHSIQEKSENTLIHLLAKTSAGELIHELKNLIESFLPFVKRQRFFSEIRVSFTPEEFRKPLSGESGEENLWTLETPIDLENMALVQALQRESLSAYHKELISELLKSGNMRRFLAALHGNTQTGKSLYNFMEDAQFNKPEFAREAEALAKWFTLPLYRTNRAGLTPLLTARKIFKNKGHSEAFVILSTAEMELGITTENHGKKPRGKSPGKTTAATLLGISCLFSFQNME